MRLLSYREVVVPLRNHCFVYLASSPNSYASLCEVQCWGEAGLFELWLRRFC